MFRRSAFTLVELLVVIAIIGMLISLLLPAIQAARETARRMQCKSNLKQVGLALSSYHNAKGSFPAGYTSTVDPADPANDKGPGWGWSAYILPYLEENYAFDQISFDKDIADPANDNARTMSISTFLCPSDTGNEFFPVDSLGDSTPNFSNHLKDKNGDSLKVGHSNYAGVFGQPEITPDPGYLISDPDRDNKHRGMFYRNSAVRIADVVDGASKTIFVGERSSNLAYVTWMGSVTGGQVPPKNPDPNHYGPEGAPVLVLGHTGDASDVPPHTPNSPANHVDDFWSTHVQGINFLFVDGSVQILKNDIDPAVWWALGTKAGREVINNDFLGD
jgi:prepilin-type N-terminal cleavage/methylation domain-containing protein/prepilin-type processing-associated H-X9-DG protein